VTDPRGIGERLYRAVLYAYPPAFRRRFAGEMIEFFRERHTRAREQGRSAAFVARTLADLARSIGAEWWRRAGAAPIDPGKVRSMRFVRTDVSAALRFLRRSPALALAVVLLMGSGIAAATAVFSVVHHVLLTAPPFAAPNRLLTIWETRPDRGPGRYSVGAHEYPIWAARVQSIERSAAFTYTGGSASLTGGGEPVALSGVRVTASFFDVLGTAPALGRGFVPDEDTPGRGQVVVISHRLWRDRFNGDAGVIGRSILLDDLPHVVVGVMPAVFAYPAPPPGSTLDIWRPIAEPFYLYRGRHYMQAIARMRDGAAASGVERDLNVVAAAIEAELPEFNKGHRVTVLPLSEVLVGDTRATLILLQAAVIGLVLIGCANVAGLLLASALSRRREFAVRLALGAGRIRVARQVLVENLVLCAAGCAAGLAGASLLTRLAPALVPATVLPSAGIRLNGTVVAFGILLSAATGLLIGLAPLAQMSGVRLTDALGGRGATPGRATLRRALVAGQIALALVLAAGAAVSIRALAALHRVDAGYDVDGIVASGVVLPGARYATVEAQRDFFRELDARLGAAPSLASTAFASATPLDGGVTGVAVGVEGQPPARPGEEISVRYRVVSEGYFATLGIPIRAGRVFAGRDARRAVPLIKWYARQPSPDGIGLPQPPPVAVINESMARAFWPDGTAIGRRFTAVLSPPITVIGIVADTRDEALSAGPRPEFYLHNLQEPIAAMSIIVRARGDGAAAGEAIRAAVWSLDPELPVGRAARLSDLVSDHIGMPRFTSMLMAAFAALALGLMAAGVYALIAFGTALRAREIGLRRALGATGPGIVTMIVRQGFALAVTGAALGVAAVAALRPAARLLPFETGAVDLPMVAAAAAAVVLVAGVASWAPARAAARVDPLLALKHD
jgi:putative ABC transport system permease protein